MSFFDRFRRRTAIASPIALGAFIDEQALLLAETSVRDYSRLRASDRADALFANPAFAAAVDKAKWEAYPRALVMIGEVVLAMLRSSGSDHLHPMLDRLIAAVTDAFDRRTVPACIGETEWRAARAEILRSLGALAERRPLPVDVVADAQASYYLAIMPLHEKLATDDFPALRRQLRALLLQVQETLAERADLPALAERLAAQPQAAPAAAPSHAG